MPTPSFDDIADVALTTDAAVLERVRDLVDGAYRRQLWLMLLERAPPAPRRAAVRRARGTASRGGARRPALRRRALGGVRGGERHRRARAPRGGVAHRGDRGWLRIAALACRAAGLPLRGPVLATDAGFRWIAAEDFLVGAE